MLVCYNHGCWGVCWRRGKCSWFAFVLWCGYNYCSVSFQLFVLCYLVMAAVCNTKTTQNYE